MHEDELFTLHLCIHSHRVLLLKDVTYNYNKTNISSITNKDRNSIKAINDRVLIIKEYLDVMKKQNIHLKDLFVSKIIRLTNTILLNHHVILNFGLWCKYYSRIYGLYKIYDLKEVFNNNYGNKYFRYIELRLPMILSLFQKK